MPQISTPVVTQFQAGAHISILRCGKRTAFLNSQNTPKILSSPNSRYPMTNQQLTPGKQFPSTRYTLIVD